MLSFGLLADGANIFYATKTSKDLEAVMNLGVLNQLRNDLNLKMSRQLYYALIYPYLNYGAMCWGNNYQTNLNMICTKQNKCIRSIFFANKQEPS